MGMGGIDNFNGVSTNMKPHFFYLLYLLRLWKDQRPKYQRNQGSFVQYAREKYMKLFISQIHIGVIGMVQIRNLFV